MDELQTPASDEQAPVTPATEPVQPEPEMVPVTDLRALQAVKDREVAAAKREAENYRQQVQAIQASQASTEGQMDALARQALPPEDYSAFAEQRQQQQQATALQRQQYEAQKLATIVDLASKNDIPISAFDAVRNNPYAQYGDAFQVVSDYQAKRLKELEQQIATRQQEAEVMARQTQRQDRQATGADSIGSPAEPATGSPDLMAQYQKRRQEILIGSQQRPTARRWTQEMLNLKAEMREKGLDI